MRNGGFFIDSFTFVRSYESELYRSSVNEKIRNIILF